MKTMIRFVAVLLTVFVAECQISALEFIKGPAVLPYGKNFPGPNTWVTVSIGDSNPDSVWSGLYSRIPYNSAGGSLADLSKSELLKLASKLDAGPEALEYDCSTSISVDTDLGRTPYDYATIAGQNYPAWPETFKLELDSSGKAFVPPQYLKVVIGETFGYQPYMPANVQGMKGVLLVIRKGGVEVIREESQNGVSDPTCTLYPGNGSYYGPDVLQLKTEYAVPEKREAGVEGEITVYLSDDHKVFATYNLDGEMIAEGNGAPPPKVAPVIRASIVDLNNLGFPAKPGEKVKRQGIRMRVSGPPPNTLVHTARSEDFVKWQETYAIRMPADGTDGEVIEYLVGNIHVYRMWVE